MKKSFILLLTCTLLSCILFAQSIKKPTKDTAKYKANDRLRTAGPTNGWKDSSKLKNSAIKSKMDTVAFRPKTDSLTKKD
jgi:hypothetical protein